MRVLPKMVYSNSQVLGFQVHRSKKVRLTHFASVIDLGSENHPKTVWLYSMISAKGLKQYTAYIFTYIILPLSFTRQRFCFDFSWPISLFALVINSLLLSLHERHRKGQGGEGRGGGLGRFSPPPLSLRLSYML